MAKDAKAKNEVQYRDMAFSIDREKLAKLATRAVGEGVAEERIPIAISSETPVRRYSWWDGEFYDEVLEHTKDAVDLSYARDGMPFLDGHDTRQQEGIVEEISIDKDGVLRGMVRFSQRQTAQDLKRDMLDGIRKKISVGYRCLETETRELEGENTVSEVRVTRWLPMEASSVPIPADYSVGVGRSAGDAPPEQTEAAIAALRKHFPHLTVTASKATARSNTMSDQNAAAENNGAGKGPVITATERDEAVKAERKRVSEIRSLAAKYNIPAEKATAWVEEGRSLENVAASILVDVTERGDLRAPTGRPQVEFNDKERKAYSFARAILTGADMREGSTPSGSFEVEIHQTLEKQVPKGVRIFGGILVPTFTSTESAREIMRQQNGWGQRAGLDSATSTKGQELKFTVAGEFLQLLRNKMALMDSGVQLLAGLQGPVAFPAQNGAATATWVGENPGSDVADSNLTLTQVALNPKSIQASTSYSRQLLAQAVVDVDSLVREDLARVNAIELDRAGINGSGASNQPLGILGQSGIGSVAGGTNGATPTYNNMVDLETQVTAANGDQWPLSYLLHPTNRGSLKKAVILGNTVGAPVWTKADAEILAARISGGSARVPGEVNGYPAWASAQVPNNLTKGTSSGICLAIIFGAFSQFVIGDWGMMELIVDPYRLKKQGMIEVTSFGMYGMALKYAAAIAAMKDALA